jgi:hypothetical protein
MNATEVLKKILTTLAFVKEEVEFTYAKLADGTILESPTFDVGESVEVVSEDGTKTAAPDGEHEVVLKDSEGNEVRIKVITKDGVITERENVELEAPKEEEVKMESIAGDDMGDDDEVDTEETAEPISEDMKKYRTMKKVMEEMSYRIEELEKKIQSMQDVKEEGGDAPKVKTESLPGDPGYKADEKMAAVEPDEDEEELPKLDGAPIDENAQKSNIKLGKNGISANPQNTFLSKLYK